MKRKVAIAGMGAAAMQIHLPAYRRLPDVEVVGGCDRDPEVRKEGFPFPLFSSVREMLEKTRPDILAVATPPESHFELTCLGLAAGCHVFCEKPFTNTLDEAEKVIALSRQLGRWVVVNHQLRFMKIHSQAKERIGSPEFGDLLFISAHQTFYRTPETETGWRGKDRRRTCKDFGIHVLDLCRFFFDEDPITVYARMPKVGDPEGPDYLNLIQLEFSRDRAAHITLDRLSRGRHRYLEIRLDGEVGCIETRLGGTLEVCAGIRGGDRKPFLDVELSAGGSARIFHGEKSRKITSDPLDVFAHATGRLLGAFLRALEEGGTPPCNAEDSRRTLALMLAAYESHEKNAIIQMRY